MSDNKYLEDILKSQTLDPDGQEMKDLRSHRSDVDKLLRKAFEKCSPTIRYGGSKAKGTMIKEAYDLDITCFFSNEETGAGETLQEIYENVEKGLANDYLITRKPSALRLKSKDLNQWAADFHIDVVPGRFIDEKNEDVFLYRSSGEKGRQKTNLDVHIEHVKGAALSNRSALVSFGVLETIFQFDTLYSSC
jgi:tRNA nucleotidyltransferase (CCA-adding enzyme)